MKRTKHAASLFETNLVFIVLVSTLNTVLLDERKSRESYLATFRVGRFSMTSECNKFSRAALFCLAESVDCFSETIFIMEGAAVV